MTKRILIIVMAALTAIATTSCSDKPDNKGGSIYDDNGENDDPNPPIKIEKDKILWIDGEANFARFKEKGAIIAYLETIKNTGFNHIIVDARPLAGDVMYKSAIVPEVTRMWSVTVPIRDWDYLGFFIEQAHKRNIKVTVSITTFTAGLLHDKNGAPFREREKWINRTSIMYSPKGMINSIDNTDKGEPAVFLNPCLKQNQDFVMSIIREIVTNYDCDGIALDYCRYSATTSENPGIATDFSSASLAAFEEYIGESVPNFPADIFTFNNNGGWVPGKFYKQWWEFRSMVIRNFVADVRREIRSIKPKVKLQYWAASWYGNRYTVGQNWASKSYDVAAAYPQWASANYRNTGFAEDLDVFLLGTYLRAVYGMDNPESIEYGIANGKKLIKGACKMYGTIFANNHKDDGTRNSIENAVYVCLRDTPGIMIFDLVQVDGFNLWAGIKRGFKRAEEVKQ